MTSSTHQIYNIVFEHGFDPPPLLNNVQKNCTFLNGWLPYDQISFQTLFCQFTDIIRMGEEADVLKFLRRRTKDLTMTPGFWNFLITLVTIVALIFYFGGAPNTKNFRQREKVVGQ